MSKSSGLSKYFTNSSLNGQVHLGSVPNYARTSVLQRLFFISSCFPMPHLIAHLFVLQYGRLLTVGAALYISLLPNQPYFYSSKSAAERKTNHRIWWPSDFDSLPRKRWRITRCCSCQMFWKCTWRTGRLNHLNLTATRPLRWVQERTLSYSQMRLHNQDCFKHWMLLWVVHYEVRSQFSLISWETKKQSKL